MSVIVVDIEADGPIPADYSMISFGAVIVDKKLDKTFYGQLKPISENWLPDALKVSGHSREETITFNEPTLVMTEFKQWIKENSYGRPLFYSDNNGFDWQFINWYFIHFLGENPFGYTSTNIGSLYKGMVSDVYQNFKHLRKTTHTHHPVDDAIGNAEALLTMQNKLGLKLGI